MTAKQLFLRAVTLAALTDLTTLAASCRAPTPRTPGPTGIFGLVRDAASGSSLPAASLQLRQSGAADFGPATAPKPGGDFEFTPLSPGHYELLARFGEQSLTVTDIEVVQDLMTPLDLAFDLGFVGNIQQAYQTHAAAAVADYRNDDATHGRLEIIVVSAAGERVEGATLYVTSPLLAEPLLLATDRHGRVKTEALVPGEYSISVYFSEVRRGNLEHRRAGLTVAPGRVTVVPLTVELPPSARK